MGKRLLLGGLDMYPSWLCCREEDERAHPSFPQGWRGRDLNPTEIKGLENGPCVELWTKWLAHMLGGAAGAQAHLWG